MVKENFVRISLGAAFAVALFASSGPAIAASNECTAVGTWHGQHGQIDTGFTWMETITPGADATHGQTTLEWVLFDFTLEGAFPNAVRATNGRGVWKKVDAHMYQYTWIGYALDKDGFLVYTARVSGTKSMVDCDHMSLKYVLELWPAGMDISTDPPIVCEPGTANQTRMQLVQASCPVP